MYEIEPWEPPQEFVAAWRCAGQLIQRMGQEGIWWVRATLNQPLVEHLSFRLGNQLFFVFVEVEHVVSFSGAGKHLFLEVSREAKATLCVLKMQRSGVTFAPVDTGWSMIDAITSRAVNPAEMVSDELIEISDWELQDFAVQVVRRRLEKQNKEVQTWQSSPQIDPSIWFQAGAGRCWVVVRAVRYPKLRADRPANLEDIKCFCAERGKTGFFASVSAASSNDPFAGASHAMPLYRGHPMAVRFKSLEPL